MLNDLIKYAIGYYFNYKEAYEHKVTIEREIVLYFTM